MTRTYKIHVPEQTWAGLTNSAARELIDWALTHGMITELVTEASEKKEK